MFRKKVIILLILCGLALGAIIFVSVSVPGAQNNVISGQGFYAEHNLGALAAELQEFTIEKNDLAEEQKQRYFELFKKERVVFLEAVQAVRSGGEGIEATLYWPVFNLGSIHRDVGAYAKAEKAFLLAHAVQPSAYPPLGNLGDLYFRYLNDYPTAEKYFLLAVEIPSDYLGTYYGELYEIYRFRYDDMARAEAVLVSASVKYPENTDIVALLAMHYRETKQTQKAIEQYRRMLALNPESIAAKTALKDLQAE